MILGFKPFEIYELELCEYNLCVRGFQEKQKEKEKDIVKLAYYTAMFNNSKKVKPLGSYLREIDRQSKGNQSKEQSKAGIEFAKKMAEKTRK